MSKASLSVTSASNQIGIFLHRFHVMIFTLLVLGGLMFAIISLIQTINSSTDTSKHASTSDSTTFDKKTIDELDSLRARSDPAQPLSLGDGRTNGFYE